MKTELLDPVTDDRLARFRQQDAIVAQMAAEYLPLRVKDHTDEAGLKAVHAARMLVVKARTTVDAIHDEMKIAIIRDGRAIDAEAKRIKALIAPIEAHLKAQEAIVACEKERLRAEAESKRKAALDARISRLVAVGFVPDPRQIEVMSDEKYDDLLSDVTFRKSEKERLAVEHMAAEAAERKRHAEELDAQRAQLAEERRKHEAEAAAERAKLKEQRRNQEATLALERSLQAERDRQRDQEAAEERAAAAAERMKLEEHLRKLETVRKFIEIENAERKAAEQAQRDTEERIAREAEAKRLAEAAEQARLAKLEAERPHREKILAICNTLEAIEVDDGPLQEAVVEVLATASDRIYELVQEYK